VLGFTAGTGKRLDSNNEKKKKKKKHVIGDGMIRSQDKCQLEAGEPGTNVTHG